MLPMEDVALLNSQRKFALEGSNGLPASVSEVLSLPGFLHTFLYTIQNLYVCLPTLLLLVHMAPNRNLGRVEIDFTIFCGDFNMSRHSKKCIWGSRPLFPVNAGSAF